MAIDYLTGKNYIKITSDTVRLGLPLAETHIYSIIKQFTENGKEQGFVGGLTYLQQWTNLSRPTVVKTLASLVDKGLIEKAYCRRNNSNVVRVKYTSINIASVVKNTAPTTVTKMCSNGAVMNERNYTKEDFDRIFADIHNYDDIDI